MPSAEAVVAMVNAGWSCSELMAMSCSDFAFWLDEQVAYVKRQNDAAKERG